MTDPESWLRLNRDAQVAFLEALVRHPTPQPPGDLAPAGELVAGLLEGLGLEVERHAVPKAALHGTGVRSVTNLIVRSPFARGGPVVALSAYGDTVPAGDGWRFDPFGGEVEDGWLYGRGALVDKSDIATFAFALAALGATRPTLRGHVELHITFDGEAGSGTGVGWLLDQGLSRPTHAIAGGLTYAVGTSLLGCLQLEVEVHGRSAHAALPGIGIDALEAAHRLLGALYAERTSYMARLSKVPGLGTPQLTVNMIEGGSHTNLLPERVRLRLDRRLVPEERLDQVEAELRASIDDALARLHGIEHEVRVLLRAEPLAETVSSRTLGECVAQHASEVLGEPVLCYGLPVYSEARHYARRGIPTVFFGAGPRTFDEGRAFRADERVPLDELHKATVVTVRALRELLGESTPE